MTAPAAHEEAAGERAAREGATLAGAAGEGAVLAPAALAGAVHSEIALAEIMRAGAAHAPATRAPAALAPATRAPAALAPADSSVARILSLMQDATGASESDARIRLDAHCHLGLMANGRDVAAQAACMGLSLFSMGVLPETLEEERARCASLPNIEVGLGLHPWYVEPDALDTQLETFEELLPGAALVGEIGLDFGTAHAHTADAQKAALSRILHLIARGEDRCLSLHAVRSAGAVLDLLEESKVLERNVAIFHWFSGTSDDLNRAIRLGAWFSVGERMLATRRGRAYVRAIPLERLLLETDAPVTPGDACSAEGVSLLLDASWRGIKEVKRDVARA